jgi:hypothetical protein
LYSSPRIIRRIKPRRIRCLSYATRMEKKRKACTVLTGFPDVKRPHEDVDVGGIIILNWILGK